MDSFNETESCLIPMPLLLEEEKQSAALIKKIEREKTLLARHFSNYLHVNSDLSRVLVSFQGNKNESGYRWFKYKEGFSFALVNYCFDKCSIRDGKILDPFAGSGATLFAASRRGLNTVGIELLPIGCEVINARKYALANTKTIVGHIKKWLAEKPWKNRELKRTKFNHLRITKGAFPEKTEMMLERCLAALAGMRDAAGKSVLRLALLSILEETSYTRKDGQYLRWDYRSGRTNGGKKFDKGEIKEFEAAITIKLHQILDDLNGENDLFATNHESQAAGNIEVLRGSCLEIMPKLNTNSFSAIMTSPPYCNRYDYTRTYALELAMQGMGEEGIRSLRQQMLSCTVENKPKDNLGDYYSESLLNDVQSIFKSQNLLCAICDYLDDLKEQDLLNNPGIARMVRNYFFEMIPTMMEAHRVLKADAPFIMVNDNVQYAGIGIPVDLILSKIAEDIGFRVETIWVLPTGKGNSSQQMGNHGRQELRKCVYVWRASKGKSASL